MKLEIKAIRNEKQYQRYLEEVDALMSLDPAPESPEGEMLETLVILIEAYEQKQGWDIPLPNDPVEVIKMRMEDLGLNQADLIPAMGDKTVVSRVLKGSRKLTYAMIAPLSNMLRIPAELLLVNETALKSERKKN